MNTLFACLLIGFAAAVGGVVGHHRQRRKSVPNFLVVGLAQIGLGLALCWPAGHILSEFSVKARQQAAAAGRTASGVPPQPHRSSPSPAPRLARPTSSPPTGAPRRQVPSVAHAARTAARGPAMGSPVRPTPTSRLYVSLKELQERLGSGSKLAYAPSMQVSHPKMPGRTKVIGTIWVWNEPDYTLYCTIGPDGVCYAASYSRSMGFTADQAVTIIRAELGDHRPAPVPGRPNEARTAHGVVLRASDDQCRITFEAPELAAFREAALAELEAERTKEIRVR